jgi:NhaA family Na+:H+ antiporter
MRLPEGRSWFAAPMRLLRSDAAGGALLILGSAVALVWSNSPAAPLYRHLLVVQIGPPGARLGLLRLVNDGLMSLFFLFVGLEIRREMTVGRLASLRGMAAPGVAALGGMVVPALIYLALNHGDAATRQGWAVPVATDIAFSLAVLRLLGGRASRSVKVFLTALAILDDLGAIVIITLFYTRHLSFVALAAALSVWLGLLLLNLLGVQRCSPYLAGGALLWLLVFESGVEATLAGVALAFVVPAQPAGEGPSVAARLEAGLAVWVALLVLPIFGLANAGLDLRAMHPAILLGPAPLGVLLGLFAGKQIGVFGAAWLGQWLKVLHLPADMETTELYGMSLLCGIGFTMSLFLGDLTFRGSALNDAVKFAILGASLLSGSCGFLVLRLRRGGARNG